MIHIQICHSKTNTFRQNEWLLLYVVNREVCLLRVASEYLVVRRLGDSFLASYDGLVDTHFQLTSVGFQNVVATWHGVCGLCWSQVPPEAIECSRL